MNSSRHTIRAVLLLGLLCAMPHAALAEDSKKYVPPVLSCDALPLAKEAYFEKNKLESICTIPFSASIGKVGVRDAASLPSSERLTFGTDAKNDFDSCRVISIQPVGTIGDCDYIGGVYHYTHHGDDPRPVPDENISATALFVHHKTDPKDHYRLAVTFADEEGGTQTQYGLPQIIDTPDGKVLYFFAHVSGTGNYNASITYHWHDGAWHPVETESWIKILQSRIPQNYGHGIWKGVWPDLKTLKATIPLYKDTDANCCATGGFAHVQLDIVADKFVLKDVAFTPSQTKNTP